MKRLAVLVAAFGLGAALAGTTPAAGQTPKHNCSFCHDLHGASYTQLRDYATAEAVCLSCHAFGGPAQVDRDGVLVTIPKGQVIHNGAKHSQPTSCWDCHNHEGEANGNLTLIQATMPTPNSGSRAVIFTTRTGLHSFADGDATYDGVCEVCHTLTSQHRNDGSVSKHNAQADCATCHKHTSGFAGGGPCTGCHNAVQGGRRAVVGEFSRRSHHVQIALPPDSIPNGDCEVCHDQSQHTQGSVRLKNVDGGATVVLTGDPAASAAEAAKLTPFCVACHDANGAAGVLAPFSDGVTRPLIDATAWNTSAHNLGSRSCYGDGSSGCHATGHGSLKKRLLAPAAVAPIGPDSTAEQEGFCLNCHRAGGPSVFDLKTAFDKPINWVAQATGLQNNANLNDRHDVQYAASSRSGYKIECTDCHNPHAATQALPYRLDPDPSDGHVVGTNWYFSAYSAARDTLSEFCLDCHDNSWAPGVVVQPTATAITDIRTTWANDGMGARTSSNVNLETGVGWALGDVIPCRSCHLAHVRMDRDFADTTNLFQAVDTVRAKAATPPYWNGAFLQGYTGNTTKSYSYAIITNANTTDPRRDAGTWCNTCHARTAMLSKDNCYTCHRHGDGGRF